ncbi:ATP-binding protein [Zunongwangia sp. F260]|uniref:histidine kinase n=1 Tax=Autumnicola lenta TaxID=3075593 RepID=A0ABU3CFJ4_9FLAO|nr:ATP-binding protein [Zunongwangia sp. F260]MDT0645122.1 ATP-binding protein [Zunongwangia sp. F260]
MSYNILDTPYEEDFDGLVKLISIICDVPVAIISMIDDQRQWYKAKTGIDSSEMPIKETFCQYTVVQDELLEIPDARLDERVKNNPHVTIEEGIRFYAGMPLKASNGHNIGTVCVADSKPRTLNKNQKTALKLLTNQAMLLLETRKKNVKLGDELEFQLEQKIKENQRQLLYQETQYNNLLKAIRKSSGVIEFNPHGVIERVNTHFLNIVGYGKEELVGQHHSYLLGEEEKENDENFWKSLRHGKFKSGRLRRKHKNGSTVWIQATYNPILDLDENVIKVIKIATDITQEILAEKALLQAKEQAEALNIQKDNFIANVSHEIRTPIHAILGFTELLLEQEKDNLRKSYLQSVKTAGDNLLFIINDILDLSKLEAGMIHLEEEQFNLQQVVKNVFAILHLKAHQKKIKFDFHINSGVPLDLKGDKNRLSQILINFLNNALKFTAEGGVDLKVELIKLANNEAVLKFKVRDTGIGIPPEKLKVIFERFSQAEESTFRKFGGTGLGLNISKHLIDRQGGTVEVSSEPGEGSCFTFTIPFKIAEKEFQDHTVTGVAATSFQKPAKILLCEDNELNQRLIRAILQEKGHEIDMAENGNKGVQLAKEREYDLILMDIQMPEKDGYQTTEVLRKDLKIVTPIIALTANFMLAEKEKCLRAGMNDYLSKPFTRDDLLAKINECLGNNGNSGNYEGNQEKSDAGLSFETLEEMSGGNKDFEKEMLSLFVKQASEMWSQLESAYEERDLPAIKATAHKFKTSFGIIGADQYYLYQLENVDKEKLSDEKLDITLTRFKDQLQQILQTVNTKLKSYL